MASLVGVFLSPSLTAQPMVSLAPDADTRLSNDDNRGPTLTYGTASLFDVRWHEAPRVRIGLVRYNITGVDSSLFATAYFTGTFTASSFNGPGDGSGQWDVYGLNDDNAGNTWDEASTSYANFPGVGGALGEVGILASETALLGTMSFDGVDVQPLPFASNPATLDLTAFLNADTDGLVSFLLISSTMDGYEYRVDTKEGNTADGHGPMMLNFGVVPEPTTSALLGLGTLALILARRRR